MELVICGRHRCRRYVSVATVLLWYIGIRRLELSAINVGPMSCMRRGTWVRGTIQNRAVLVALTFVSKP